MQNRLQPDNIAYNILGFLPKKYAYAILTRKFDVSTFFKGKPLENNG